MQKFYICLFLVLFVQPALGEAVVGSAAPDFELQGSDGKTYTLSQFESKKSVVIAFFPRVFTGGWTAECKSLRDSASIIQQYDVAYFMASTDQLSEVTAFAKKNKANFPILADTNKSVAKRYGVLSAMGFAKRWTFYIDPQGTLVHIDKSVSAVTAGPDLAANLERLNL